MSGGLAKTVVNETGIFTQLLWIKTPFSDILETILSVVIEIVC